MSMFRNLIGMSDPYVFLDHIVCNGGQHVNFTTIIPSDHKLEIKLSQSSYNNDNHYFGANDLGPNDDASQYFSMTTYNRKYYWGGDGVEYNGGTWSSGTKTIIYNDFNDHEVKISNTVIGTGNNITTTGYFFLFKRANVNPAAENSGKFVGNFYYCKLWDRTTEELVLNVVPAKRTSDGVVGLYDLVSNTFYTNDGTGTFGE